MGSLEHLITLLAKLKNMPSGRYEVYDLEGAKSVTLIDAVHSNN
jgi:hypothetical protein